MHGTILRELLSLFYQIGIEKEPQQIGQCPVCQSPQQFLFSGFSEHYQARKLQLVLVESDLTSTTVRCMLTPLRKLSGIPGRHFLSIYSACHKIPMVNLHGRKGAFEKYMHTIIPRNELFIKQSERRGLLLQLSFERIPQDSTPQAPTVGNKPEKQQSENGGREGKGRDLHCIQGWCLTDKLRDLSTCRAKQLS